MADETAADVVEQDEQNGQDSAQTGDATGTNSGETARTFSQQELDRIVKERLERAEAKRAEAEQRAREEAEAAALAEQERYKELAEKRAAQVEELEAKAERASRYEEVITSLLEAQLKDVPDHILPLLERLDPVEQLDYLSKNRGALAPPPDPEPGRVPATPRATNGRRVDSEAQAARRGVLARKVRGWM